MNELIWWICFIVPFMYLLALVYVQGWQNGKGWPHNDYRQFSMGFIFVPLILIIVLYYKP